MEQQAVIKTVGGQSLCKTCLHGEFLRIAKIVQVSAMKVHFQIAECNLSYAKISISPVFARINK